jgi:hypothetical protein
MKMIFCAAACLAAMSAAANGVTDWSAVTERFANEKRPSGSAEVLIGLTHAAMYDAVAATQGGLRPILATGVPRMQGSADVAAAVAAHGVLKARLPAQAAALDAELEKWMATQADDAATRRGAEAGRQVARAVIEARNQDGFDAKEEWKAREKAAGVWEPTAAGGPVDHTLGRVKPIGMVDLAKHRPRAPEMDGEVRSRDLAEVRNLGRKESTARTAAQTETAMFWSDHTATQYSRALRGLAAERNLDTPRERSHARDGPRGHGRRAHRLLRYQVPLQRVAARPCHPRDGAGGRGALGIAQQREPPRVPIGPFVLHRRGDRGPRALLRHAQRRDDDDQHAHQGDAALQQPGRDRGGRDRGAHPFRPAFPPIDARGHQAGRRRRRRGRSRATSSSATIRAIRRTAMRCVFF